jgi:nicotinamidase/pyrazinamidase
MLNVDLIVIDGENDFCNSGKEPKDWPTPAGGMRPGALYVAGADVEAQNLAQFIRDLAVTGNNTVRHLLRKIRPTLDKHHPNDCAHHTAWKDSSGNTPPPFTIVSHDDVVNHRYTPRFAFGVWNGKIISAHEWALRYTEALAKRGRNPLCLWPEHCLIDTWGSCAYHPLQEAYNFWEKQTGQFIDWVTKGEWPFTEHYSAVEADVPDPTRRETQMNTELINAASTADMIVWSGWAGSHCLKWTALDAVNYFEPTDAEKKTGKRNEFVAKSVFIEDASAAVGNFPGGPDFAQWRRDFLDEVSSRGARVMKMAEVAKEIKAAA